MLNEGLEVFGNYCDDIEQYDIFSTTSVTEITFPSTLKKIGKCVFSDNALWNTIYVSDGCQADLSQLVT